MNSTKNDAPIPFCVESFLALLVLHAQKEQEGDTGYEFGIDELRRIQKQLYLDVQNKFIAPSFFPEAIVNQKKEDMQNLAIHCGHTSLMVRHLLGIDDPE